MLANTGGYALGIAAILLGGWLSDKYGRRPVCIWGNFASLLMIYPVFAWITSTRSEFALIVGMTLLNGVWNLMWGAFYAALAESLPTTIRGSGFGIVYSASIAVFGGTTQLIVTWLIHVTGSDMAPAWYMLGAGAIGQVALLLMAESAPRQMARAS